MKRYIKLDANNKVIEVRESDSPRDGDIESNLGENGQIMQEDGTFITPPTEPVAVKPTLEEQITTLQQDNLILMDALASVYEQLLIMQTGGA